MGGEGDILGAVDEAVGAAEPGAVGEGQVLLLHDLAGRGGGRGHQDGDVAEVEEHQRAEPVRQGVEGAVGVFAQLVEVSDYGELWRRWREAPPRGWRRGAPAAEEEGEEEYG